MLAPLAPQLDQVQKTLEAHLPWTEHDFVREPTSFLDGDRFLTAQRLTRRIDARNDLRFRYRDDDLEIAIIAERLPWDTDFFGYEIARLHGIHTLTPPHYDYELDYSSAVVEFLDALRKRGIECLLARAFPEDLASLRALGKTGFELITSLNYYHRTVQDYDYPHRFAARNATPQDVPFLTATARNEVNPYDRFHADPSIARKDADRMMERWVEASVLDGFADFTIVPDVEQPRAFCTINYHQESWEAWGAKMGQFVLSAVDRSFKGWYLNNFSEMMYRFKAMGFERAFVSTQVTNRAAIRQCEKLGFRYGRGEHCFRKLL